MVSHTVIVLICIVAAGVGVLLGWAVYRLYSSQASEKGTDPENVQAIYMREVRQRNREVIADLNGYRLRRYSQ